MSHAADPKNGMLHVSKTAKFKHYNTKPLGQRIVEFDIKGKQVADKTFSTVALTPLSVKAVADLTSRKVKMSKTLKGCKPRRQLLIIWNISITSFRITPCVLTTSVNKTTLMRSLRWRQIDIIFAETVITVVKTRNSTIPGSLLSTQTPG